MIFRCQFGKTSNARVPLVFIFAFEKVDFRDLKLLALILADLWHKSRLLKLSQLIIKFNGNQFLVYFYIFIV